MNSKKAIRARSIDRINRGKGHMKNKSLFLILFYKRPKEFKLYSQSWRRGRI
jgi:hypothetical protein